MKHVSPVTSHLWELASSFKAEPKVKEREGMTHTLWTLRLKGGRGWYERHVECFHGNGYTLVVKIVIT